MIFARIMVCLPFDLIIFYLLFDVTYSQTLIQLIQEMIQLYSAVIDYVISYDKLK